MTSFIIEAIEFDARRRTGSFLLRQQHGQSHSVTVSRRGLLNVASPPRDTAGRFLEFVGIFAKIADRRLGSEEGRTYTLTAEDVRHWLRTCGRTRN